MAGGRDAVMPPGLTIEDDFITEAEEEALVREVQSRKWCTALARRTQHYGFRFNYNTIVADPDGADRGGEAAQTADAAADSKDDIPCSLAFDTLNEASRVEGRPRYNQLTVNEYQPGMGISAHCETHSCFEEGFCSISLLSGIAMRFERPPSKDYPEATSVSIWLPRRSRVVFCGEVRLVWKHGIAKRKTDLVDGVVIPRSLRISLTYREVKSARGCSCADPVLCDYQNPGSVQLPTGRLGAAKPDWWREKRPTKREQ